MAIVAHIVNTYKTDAREAYESAWRLMDEQGMRHPKGRTSHTAWLVDDALHVCDVWNSQEDMNVFMRDLGPILEQFELRLASAPEVGELLNVVRPPD
jgi:hypothetical protein